MKTKIFALLILAIIALSIIGYSYACYNGGVHIDCYCQPNCNIRFTYVTTSDNEHEKYVADVQAQITCDGDTIQVSITNAYPCYEAYINYTIKNKGTCPIHFNSLTIINPNPEALDITTTNHTCTLLPPGDMVQGTTAVHILQPAEQDWEYNFQIKIGVSCQEGNPCTIGFWKNQFPKALCKSGNPQVNPTKLEQYLDQITSKSKVYNFTGTQKEKFQQALDILDLPRRPTPEAKLKAQLLALWLNYVAGWTAGYTVEGMTAIEIIEGSEEVLNAGQTADYEYWKDLCDDFNNLK